MKRPEIKEFELFVLGVYGFIKESGEAGARDLQTWSLIFDLLTDIISIGKSLSIEKQIEAKKEVLALAGPFMDEPFLRLWAIRQLRSLGCSHSEIFQILRILPEH